MPIPQKETLRWADKLNDAAALLGESGCGEHIGGRNAGLDELFGAAIEVGAHFLIRRGRPCLAKNGNRSTDVGIEEVRFKGVCCIEIRDRAGGVSEAVLKLRYRRRPRSAC